MYLKTRTNFAIASIFLLCACNSQERVSVEETQPKSEESHEIMPKDRQRIDFDYGKVIVLHEGNETSLPFYFEDKLCRFKGNIWDFTYAADGVAHMALSEKNIIVDFPLVDNELEKYFSNFSKGDQIEIQGVYVKHYKQEENLVLTFLICAINDPSNGLHLIPE